MLIRFIKFCCLFAILATQSLLAGNGNDIEREKFPPPRSKPEEIPKFYKSFEPRLHQFMIPAGIAAIGLSVGAVKATACSEEDSELATSESVSTLAFFVESSLGGDSDSGEMGGSITVEIEFPDMSLLDTITFSVDPTFNPITETELSNSTTDFESGDQFTLNVTAVADMVNSVTATMRINGIDILAQTEADPTIATSFVFTIP